MDMTGRQIVLSGALDSAKMPLYVIRFRMPSENRKNLTKEERAKYHEAYFEAWRELSRLGIKDTTSTILSRKPRNYIEKGIQRAIEAYEKRGLMAPRFTKTSIDVSEESDWIQSAIEAVSKRIERIEKKLMEMSPEERQKKAKRYMRHVEKMKRKLAEITQEAEVEEVLKRL
jgi:hypothetical protein